ncbi:MAG: DNA mismatch repair protein MutS [Nitrospirae bacterium]|nr:MAG: DNA mismatch repair protein MutS [Nitrospirota bacterium]
MPPDLTPLMRQYRQVKQQHPEAILFFRVGDFYEMFYEDAVEGARLLDIALTSRDKNKADQVPLCGIPYHAATAYIAKLLRAGRSVALCDQVEDPQAAKGLVRREVVRLYTPGTLIEPDLLAAGEPNYLAALAPGPAGVGLAWLDLSTGEFRVLELGAPWTDALRDELLRIEPKEILVPDHEAERLRAVLSFTPAVLTSVEGAAFHPPTARALLLEHFRVASLAGFGCDDKPLAVPAAGALLRYVKETQPGASLAHMARLQAYARGSAMILDRATQRNLELVRRPADGQVDGSLLSVLDRTLTPMGARLLREWLLHPLTELPAIAPRQAAVADLHDDLARRSRLRTALRGVSDLERLMSRVVLGVANARDLCALTDSIAAVPDITRLLASCAAPLLRERAEPWDDLARLAAVIDRTLHPEPPASLREGGLIREGFHAGLDELRAISRDGKAWIARIETQERQRTGIDSLKIRYNQVFGYYIEVTKPNLPRVPAEYIRKQTVANAERFITQELKTLEDKVLGAEDRSRALEYELFDALRREAAAASARVQALARTLALADAVASLAEAAAEGGYCRPELIEGDALTIKDGRHPVLERQALPGGFIPNDVQLGGPDRRLLVITGPNMAGKSTYLRQAALIVLMAQMGGFVPAKSASIGLVDRIFTRIGAADNLVEGQSTFMVEMTETANILHHATARSLIILDEIGRGTSTFDGLSIAWAVAECLADRNRIGARTLFATHYHELTDLMSTHAGVRNYNVAVRERGDEILFLRKIVEGGADRSYGIHVAQLAGLPRDVITRAADVLARLENGPAQDAAGQLGLDLPLKAAPDPTLPAPHPILEEVRQMDLFGMTPLEAMNKLAEIKERLEKEEGGA